MYKYLFILIYSHKHYGNATTVTCNVTETKIYQGTSWSSVSGLDSFLCSFLKVRPHWLMDTRLPCTLTHLLNFLFVFFTFFKMIAVNHRLYSPVFERFSKELIFHSLDCGGGSRGMSFGWDIVHHCLMCLTLIGVFI